MKKTLILLTSLIAISCQNNVPKCDDPEVFNTIYSIINENKDKLRNESGNRSLIELLTKNITSENTKITEIMTTKNDTELNSCGCEGKLIITREGSTTEGLIEYTAQKNSENEIIVKVENIPVLQDKFK